MLGERLAKGVLCFRDIWLPEMPSEKNEGLLSVNIAMVRLALTLVSR